MQWKSRRQSKPETLRCEEFLNARQVDGPPFTDGRKQAEIGNEMPEGRSQLVYAQSVAAGRRPEAPTGREVGALLAQD
jgi:hypothetical protein